MKLTVHHEIMDFHFKVLANFRNRLAYLHKSDEGSLYVSQFASIKYISSITSSVLVYCLADILYLHQYHIK